MCMEIVCAASDPCKVRDTLRDACGTCGVPTVLGKRLTLKTVLGTEMCLDRTMDAQGMLSAEAI